MNEKLKNLYQTVILQHNGDPFHFEKKQNATYQLEASNPVCGDRFKVFFEVKNGVFSDVFFHGYGCAIAKASTSILVKNLENQPVELALDLCRAFINMVQPDAPAGVEMGDEFTAFAAAKDFPGRLKCATLAWDEMAVFLENQIAEHEN